MAEAFKKLAQSLIPTSVAPTYTVPGATSAVVKHIVINNPSGSSVISLYHDGTSDVNLILNAIPLAAGERYEGEVVITMEASDTLQVKDTGQNNVAAIVVYGLEIS